MCIIVAKPQGISMPSMKTLKTCFEHNPDGAGFAYLDNGNVVYRKGFMTFNSLKNALDELKINKKEATMVFHFRIGTAGTNSKGLTHPFRICNDTNAMKLTEGKGSVLFHNGILADYNPSKDNKDDVNDTMLFTKKVINELPKDWETNKAILSLVKKSISYNKLAILKPSGLTLIGDFKKDDGIYYSNESYKEYRTVYVSPRYGYEHYGHYDDWDYPVRVNPQYTSKESYRTDDLMDDNYLYTKDEFNKKYIGFKRKIVTAHGKFLFTYDGKIWEEVKYGDEICYEKRVHKAKKEVI